MNRQWQTGDEFGSDILGTGSFHGSLGKADTAQIGFVRKDSKPVPSRQQAPKVTGRQVIQDLKEKRNK